MAGKALPAQGFLSDAGRTEGQMKTGLEDQRDAVARGWGCAEDQALTIAIGAITPASDKGALLGINPEGGVPDDLATINTTNTIDGSFVALYNQTANLITVKHNGASTPATIFIGSQTDFVLDGNALSVLILFQFNGSWFELARGYGSDLNAFHNYLGLGNAAFGTTGPGNGFDADTVDGKHESDFLGVAGVAADSLELGGVVAANYARKDLSAQQVFAGALQARTLAEVVGLLGVDATVDLLESTDTDPANGVRRLQMRWDAANNRAMLRTYDTNGTTIYTELRMPASGGDPDLPQYLHPSDATLYGVITEKEHDAHVAIARLVSDRLYVPLDSGYTFPLSTGVRLAPPAWEGLIFPRGADGSRKYRVTRAWVIQMVAGFVDSVIHRLHLGTTGDATDAIIWSYSESGAAPADRSLWGQLSWGIDAAARVFYPDNDLEDSPSTLGLRGAPFVIDLVPATNEKLTLSWEFNLRTGHTMPSHRAGLPSGIAEQFVEIDLLSE